MSEEFLNFQYESPIPPEVAKLLSQLLTNTPPNPSLWATPGKAGAAGNSSQTLLGRAMEIFRSGLGLSESEILLHGSTNLQFHWAITGLANRYLSRGEKVTIIHSPIDRQEVHAVADSLYFQHCPVKKLAIDHNGYFDPIILDSIPDSENAILIWQISNIELGTIQEPSSELLRFLQSANHHIVIDATGSGAQRSLDKYIPNWDLALYDVSAWGGIAGTGIMAINNPRDWRNPNPNISPKFNAGEISPALVTTSALLLESYLANYEENQRKLIALKNSFLQLLQVNFPNSDVVSGQNPAIVSISFADQSAPRLVGELTKLNIAVDSGSTCAATLCEPSYVLDALNRPSSGNLRFNLKVDHTVKDLHRVISALNQLLN
jgi:cysteine sulfinate desulfinase/cysteine desulfurase-like protein